MSIQVKGLLFGLGVFAVLGIALFFVPVVENDYKSFVDVTESAGLFHRHAPEGFSECKECEDIYGVVREMSAFAAHGDYDGDGWLDLYVSRIGVSDSLYKNNGDGTFSDVTESVGIVSPQSSSGVVFVDFDQDGDEDILVATIGEEPYALFENQGNESFVERAQVYGFVSSAENNHAFGIGVGDVNNDGAPDVYVSQWGIDAGASQLFVNDNGVFVDETQERGLAAVFEKEYNFASQFVDLDQDGWEDFVLVGDFGTTRLFWNNEGVFEEEVGGVFGVDENGMDVAIADYDKDGRLDVFISSIYQPEKYKDAPTRLLRCSDRRKGKVPHAHQTLEYVVDLNSDKGEKQVVGQYHELLGECDPGYRMTSCWSGTFLASFEGRNIEELTTRAGVRDVRFGWGSEFVDLNNDGYEDLVVANGFERMRVTENMRVFMNQQDGTFVERAEELGFENVTQGRDVVVFDYDNDGDMDVFVANNGTEPKLYRNEFISEQNF